MIETTEKLKRNQVIYLQCPEGHRTPVKYAKKFGIERPNYIIVTLPDGRSVTTWRQDLYLTP